MMLQYLFSNTAQLVSATQHSTQQSTQQSHINATTRTLSQSGLSCQQQSCQGFFFDLVHGTPESHSNCISFDTAHSHAHAHSHVQICLCLPLFS